MPNQSGKIVLILVLLLVFSGVVFYLLSPGLKNQKYTDKASDFPIQSLNKEASKSSELTRDYYSKNLKISFKIPQEAKITDKFINIDISVPEGNISVTRNGTNFKNAKGYYRDLKTKNNLSPKEYFESSNKKYDFISVLDDDPHDNLRIKKSYFVYADYAIYIFSTSDESLYPVLDQIVQSFEYKGTLSSGEDKR